MDYLKKGKKKFVKPDAGFRAVHLDGNTTQAVGGPSVGAEVALLVGSSQPVGMTLPMLCKAIGPSQVFSIYLRAAGERKTHPDDHIPSAQSSSVTASSTQIGAASGFPTLTKCVPGALAPRRRGGRKAQHLWQSSLRRTRCSFYHPSTCQTPATRMQETALVLWHQVQQHKTLCRCRTGRATG